MTASACACTYIRGGGRSYTRNINFIICFTIRSFLFIYLLFYVHMYYTKASNGISCGCDAVLPTRLLQSSVMCIQGARPLYVCYTTSGVKRSLSTCTIDSHNLFPLAFC